MGRFLIAAAHKSSGKTVISTGLAGALTARGLAVQCYKKGPDYIDPMWLSAASGRPCYNLDFNTMSAGEFTALMCNRSRDADVAMIEANKGLYDGVALDGSDSNAAVAKATQTPVILVIDTNGMTRGIAPLLVGYRAFDPEVNIAGVILNKVGGPRHEAKLRAAVAEYTGIPVVGAVARNAALDIGERHLGLTTPAETGHLTDKVDAISRIVGDSVDLDLLIRIAGAAPDNAARPVPETVPEYSGLRIAVARDMAFGFYYADDLEAFENLGAELVFFDATTAPALPDGDGVFIGGGFPETRMQALAANTSLRADIREKLLAGMPCYAECGGLMYLCRSMEWNGEKHDMCGVVEADSVMCARPQGRGYAKYNATPAHPWGLFVNDKQAHEFHYARLENLASDTVFARGITRGCGIDGHHDGIVVKNVVAGFVHLRNSSTNNWVERFLGFVRKTGFRRTHNAK
jgi:cobyrinic acid a,c-diamide synthase